MKRPSSPPGSDEDKRGLPRPSTPLVQFWFAVALFITFGTAVLCVLLAP